MAEHVERPGERLAHGGREGVGGVEHREAVERATHAVLLLGLLVGDDRAVVHLGARAKDRDHGAHRDALGGELVLCELHLPDVSLGLGLHGDDLAAVDHRAAAHGEDEVNAALAVAGTLAATFA